MHRCPFFRTEGCAGTRGNLPDLRIPWCAHPHSRVPREAALRTAVPQLVCGGDRTACDFTPDEYEAGMRAALFRR